MNNGTPRRPFSGLATAAVELSKPRDDAVAERRTALADTGAAAKKAPAGASRARVARAATTDRCIMLLNPFAKDVRSFPFGAVGVEPLYSFA